MWLTDRIRGWFTPKADALSDLLHPTAWLRDWALGRPTLAGVSVTPASAMTLPTYYACIRAISEDIGKLPLITYRRLEPRGKERAPDHPLYTLLHDAPNDDMEAMTFRETLTHYALAWGNGYALIDRDSRMQPISLHPIHPSRVVVRRDDDGLLVYDVYGGELLPGAHLEQVYRVRADDMIHIRGLGAEGIVGYSVAQLMAESLGLTLAAQTFGAAFFGNGASMSGVLEHPGKLSDQAATHLRESFQAVYGGPQNTGKVGILEEGMKYSRMAIPPNDAQFLETRLFQVHEIARIFRIPLHKVNELENATYTNIEQQAIEYVVDTLMPWCKRWEEHLHRKLFGIGSRYFCEHAIQGLMRGDQAARSQFYTSLFGIGVFSPNDIRELENMSPIGEEGDEYFVASNNLMPLKQVVEQAEQPQPAMVPMGPTPPGRNGSNGAHHGLD
jgi:HK97 family phage portal protein